MSRKGHKQPKHHPNKDQQYLDQARRKQDEQRDRYLDPVDLRTAHTKQLDEHHRQSD